MASSSPNGREQFLYTGVGSDFKIICRNRVFYAHKVILAPVSEYFRKLFESDFKEAKNNEIDLSIDDPHVLKTLLETTYNPAVYPWKAGTIGNHVHLYALAEKYGITDIKAKAVRGFKLKVMDESISGRSLLQLVSDIYASSASADCPLREAILDVFSDFERESDILNGNERTFKELAMETPEFVADLALRLHKTLEKIGRYC
ncbi:hypothetical protein NA57DRAFT_79210 [Rhizodiscina lignyota]|uniref:BTB domain-containing protein n=1 Tax=Rhizodiscina lignyota TaxID=1504668 RepID=A0A9P4M2A7_9PEZI|nr:hypothetical protein NA57DRAFT_79210 [Rhizodiscina lignyota]